MITTYIITCFNGITGLTIATYIFYVMAKVDYYVI